MKYRHPHFDSQSSRIAPGVAKLPGPVTSDCEASSGIPNPSHYAAQRAFSLKAPNKGEAWVWSKLLKKTKVMLQYGLC